MFVCVCAVCAAYSIDGSMMGVSRQIHTTTYPHNFSFFHLLFIFRMKTQKQLMENITQTTNPPSPKRNNKQTN